MKGNLLLPVRRHRLGSKVHLVINCTIEINIRGNQIMKLLQYVQRQRPVQNLRKMKQKL